MAYPPPPSRGTEPPELGEIVPDPPKAPSRGGFSEPPGGALESGESYFNFLLDGATWIGAEGRYINIREALLRRVRWGESRLDTPRLTDVHLESCDLAGAQWANAHWLRVALEECRLLGLGLPDAQLHEVRVSRCNGSYGSFRFATLDTVRWEGCNLYEADFSGATLTNVRFEGCDLRRADLSGASLTHVDLSGSQLEGLRIGPESLRGLIIEPSQALDLVTLLGVEIRWDR